MCNWSKTETTFMLYGPPLNTDQIYDYFYKGKLKYNMTSSPWTTIHRTSLFCIQSD